MLRTASWLAGSSLALLSLPSSCQLVRLCIQMHIYCAAGAMGKLGLATVRQKAVLVNMAVRALHEAPFVAASRVGMDKAWLLDRQSRPQHGIAAPDRRAVVMLCKAPMPERCGTV